MPLIVEKSAALEALEEAREKGWVLPAFNTENLQTTEAVLAAAMEQGEALGERGLPLFVAITNRYHGRQQTLHYAACRDAMTGLALFFADLQALCAEGSPYAKVRVFAHLDHGQWDDDADLIGGPLEGFASVMFDASTLPFVDNIARTAEFVALRGKNLLIEGACDEIPDSGGMAGPRLTTVERAEEFFSATGVDLIVPNVGTEHRASAVGCRYESSLACEISKRVGARLCLHGTSSLEEKELHRLAGDGIVKANNWTALEREAGAAVCAWMIEHAGSILGPERTQTMRQAGWLGPAGGEGTAPALSAFTASARNVVAFEAIKSCALRHLRAWMPADK